jgi:hypothetical protein
MDVTNGRHWADVIGRMPRGRMSHGQASLLTGCHWPGGRVVLANEYIYYIVKKTWHSTGGCHWADVTWSDVTWPGATDRMSLAGRSCRVGQRIYILYS